MLYRAECEQVYVNFQVFTDLTSPPKLQEAFIGLLEPLEIEVVELEDFLRRLWTY